MGRAKPDFELGYAPGYAYPGIEGKLAGRLGLVGGSISWKAGPKGNVTTTFEKYFRKKTLMLFFISD